MRTLLTLFILAIGLLAGCAQQDEDRYKEKAQVEENAKSNAELNVLNARAKEMETDLERRHRFYQSISGSYTGTYTTTSGAQFATKLKLIPSLPSYVPSNRVRTLEEISADINNLYFNIQILHWAPANPASATGCVFQEVRGDLEMGLINVAQAACPNVYSVHVVDPTGAFQKPGELEINSKSLAQKILIGSATSVEVIKLFMQPANNAGEYAIELRKVTK